MKDTLLVAQMDAMMVVRWVGEQKAAMMDLSVV